MLVFNNHIADAADVGLCHLEAVGLAFSQFLVELLLIQDRQHIQLRVSLIEELWQVRNVLITVIYVAQVAVRLNDAATVYRLAHLDDVLVDGFATTPFVVDLA